MKDISLATAIYITVKNQYSSEILQSRGSIFVGVTPTSIWHTKLKIDNIENICYNKDIIEKHLFFHFTSTQGVNMENYQFSSLSKNEHSLFFSDENDEMFGRIGHLRGAFGDGEEFANTWFTHKKALCTKEFYLEFDKVVSCLRNSEGLAILENREAMAAFCNQNPSLIDGVWHDNTHGYKIVTPKYSFYIRCFPMTGDFNVYIYCYDNSILDEVLLEAIPKRKHPYKPRSKPTAKAVSLI